MPRGCATAIGAGAAPADDNGQGRGLILFDMDNDGDLDIFIVNNQVLTLPMDRDPGPPVLLRNESNGSNYWLDVTLAGTPPFHRYGIGSRVYVTVGTNTQMPVFWRMVPGRIAHVGLGSNLVADEVAEWGLPFCCGMSRAISMWRFPVHRSC